MKNSRILTLIAFCFSLFFQVNAQDKAATPKMSKEVFTKKVSERLKSGLKFSDDQITKANVILDKYAEVPADNSLNIIDTDAERELMEIMTESQALQYKKERHGFWSATPHADPSQKPVAPVENSKEPVKYK